MDLTQGKIDAVIVDPITGGSRYISEAIQERKDQIRDDMTIGEKFSDLVSRGERYGDEDRTRFNDPAELIGKRVPSYEDRRRESDPRYKELLRMRDDYKSEMDRNSGLSGLMSLLRGTGDMVLGEDIMDNLPMLLRAMEGTNKDTLTMEQIRDMSGPLDESSFSMQLSNTPGLESLVGPEIGLALGAVGGGGKGKSIKEILEEIQRLGGRMASDRDMDATRYLSEENLPEFLKSFSQLQRERRGREGFENMKDDLLDERATEYFEGPQGLKAINIDRRNLQRMMDEDPQVAPREMASGGRPGLYANINAKRKRIAAGSGERMRRKGEEGAPTAKNFRDSAKTAKKAHGGSLGYMKGYYGKSYK